LWFNSFSDGVIGGDLKMSERPDRRRWLALPILAIGLALTMLVIGTTLNERIDESIDYSILHEQIISNQTFVDLMTCDDVKFQKALVEQINSPNQQDEVLQLRSDYKKLLSDKRCPTEESYTELWTDVKK